jgi:hypothetical protein
MSCITNRDQMLSWLRSREGAATRDKVPGQDVQCRALRRGGSEVYMAVPSLQAAVALFNKLEDVKRVSYVKMPLPGDKPKVVGESGEDRTGYSFAPPQPPQRGANLRPSTQALHPTARPLLHPTGRDLHPTAQAPVQVHHPPPESSQTAVFAGGEEEYYTGPRVIKYKGPPAETGAVASLCEVTVPPAHWAGAFPWSRAIEQLNSEVFGNPRFRANQREAINAALAGYDVFVMMPTGGGKSLIFQLCALACPGVTVVVMPLLSLIQDQTMSLQVHGGYLLIPSVVRIFSTRFECNSDLLHSF